MCLYDHGVLLFDVIGGGQNYVSGERSKVLARAIGVSERVIDETADETCGFTCATMVGFQDFQLLYFEMFSRIQPPPCFGKKNETNAEMTAGELQQTDFDMHDSARDVSNLL
jgi:hypothetical protein